MSLLNNLRANLQRTQPQQSETPPAPGAIQRRAGQPEMPPLTGDTFKDILDQEDNRPQRSRIGGNGYVHASSLIGLCARQYALATRYEVEITEDVHGGHRVVWAMGRAAERHVRDQFIKARQRQGIYGKWECRCGQTEHIGTVPNFKCGTCDKPLHTYKEAPIFDHDRRIVGNCDLPFFLDRHMVITEIKSMNKKDFEALERPKPDHVHQAKLYHYLYSHNGFRMHEKALVHYVCKDFKWGSPYKTYAIDMHQQGPETMLADALAIAEQLRDARNGRLPERTVCSTPESRAAKKCPVAHLCFNVR